ncbi:MAG: hypothetical protein P1U49_15155 [Minwuia sp.]|nr:hypothetical protein [Minwuia sp.]
MTVSEDAELVSWLQSAVQTGVLRMHVNYRKARRNDAFHQALVARVGARAVKIRDRFLFGSFALLLVWFGFAEALELNTIMLPVAGSEMSLGSITFFALLLALVLAGRRFVRPLQGRLLHEVVTSDAELFDSLWRAGALALMAMSGSDRLCSSPKGDWRQFVRQARQSVE